MSDASERGCPAAQVGEAVALLRGAGFEDISIDLISGLPGARAPCAPRPLPPPSPVGLCAIMPVAIKSWLAHRSHIPLTCCHQSNPSLHLS